MTTTAIGIGLDAIGYHDKLAVSWETRYRKGSFRSRLTALEECLKNRGLEGTKWLDAGCGTGTLSRWLAERGCSVLGVDAAPQMVDAATRLSNAGALHGSLRFEFVDTIARLPLSSHSLDGVLCSSVLEYVPDPEACLAEFARVLRPGGTLLVSLPNASSLLRQSQLVCKRISRLFGKDLLRYLDYSKSQYSRVQFQRIVSSHGFHLDKVVALGGPLPQWAQRTYLLGPLLMFSATRSQSLVSQSAGRNVLSRSEDMASETA